MISKALFRALVVSAAFILPVNADALETVAKYAIVVDGQTGQVILNKDADVKMPPSSMSKLMTAYLTFNELKAGRLKLDQQLPVSQKAWEMQGSKTFVPIGETISVDDLLKGVIVQSGNDACVVLAEAIAGTEEDFARKANEMAQKIGLTSSTFRNATGWPDEQHLMTARDLSTLARRIVEDFPEYYHYYSIREFTFNNITQQNRNVLLGRGIGVDGLKTGHTEAAGYGITISAKQGNRRVYVVVNGLPSDQDRAYEAEKLVNYAFREFSNRTIARSGDVITQIPVFLGSADSISAKVDQDFMATLPNDQLDKVKAYAVYQSPLIAPVKAGDKVGELVLRGKDGSEVKRSLIAVEDAPKASFISRIFKNIGYKLFGYSS